LRATAISLLGLVVFPALRVYFLKHDTMSEKKRGEHLSVKEFLIKLGIDKNILLEKN
jgi:hypothetical protein